MWILGSPLKEAAYLYLPGLIAVLSAIYSPELGEQSFLYSVLAMGIIDSGHVYTTMWRTWLHGEEVRTSSQYWILPLFFFGLFFTWIYLDLPYLWAFVVYSTFFHHFRQVYGVTKWYQKLNGRMDRYTDLAVYFFSVVPLVTYHLRPEAISGYYTDHDLFLFPDPVLRDIFVYSYFVGATAWGIREYRLWSSGIRETNRVLSVAVPAVIYAYCFLVGETITQVLFPLLFLHGITYFGLLEHSLVRTQKRFSAKYVATFVVLITAIVLGLIEAYAEENYIGSSRGDAPLRNSLIIGLALTPLFCHYAFDAIIWRKGHREAKLVFGKDAPGNT